MSSIVLPNTKYVNESVVFNQMALTELFSSFPFSGKKKQEVGQG